MLCVGFKLIHQDNDKESVHAKEELHDISGSPFFESRQEPQEQAKHQPRTDTDTITGWDLRNLMKRVASEGQSASQGKIVKQRIHSKQFGASHRKYLRQLRPKTSNVRPLVSYSQPVYGNLAARLCSANPETEVFRHRGNVIPSRIESLRQSTCHSSNAMHTVRKPAMPPRISVAFSHKQPPSYVRKEPLKVMHPRSDICNYSAYKSSTATRQQLPHRPLHENWKRHQQRLHGQHRDYLQQINQLLSQQEVRFDLKPYSKHPQ